MADKIIEWVIGFNSWAEENKKNFIKNNNPDLYKKLYGKNNQRENKGNE